MESVLIPNSTIVSLGVAAICTLLYGKIARMFTDENILPRKRYYQAKCNREFSDGVKLPFLVALPRTNDIPGTFKFFNRFPDSVYFFAVDN